MLRILIDSGKGILLITMPIITINDLFKVDDNKPSISSFFGSFNLVETTKVETTKKGTDEVVDFTWTSFYNFIRLIYGFNNLLKDCREFEVLF